VEHAITVVQLAQILHISQGTIRNMIKEEDPTKRIPYVRIGKSYRFFPSEIAKFFSIDPKTLNIKE
jgi:excisionase family DNA binding protein